MLDSQASVVVQKKKKRGKNVFAYHITKSIRTKDVYEMVLTAIVLCLEIVC